MNYVEKRCALAHGFCVSRMGGTGGAGPYAGGVRGVSINRPLCGRGPRVYMCLHGAWPPCMAVASGWAVVGFSLYSRLSVHMKSYV